MGAVEAWVGTILLSLYFHTLDFHLEIHNHDIHGLHAHGRIQHGQNIPKCLTK